MPSRCWARRSFGGKIRRRLDRGVVTPQAFASPTLGAADGGGLWEVAVGGYDGGVRFFDLDGTPRDGMLAPVVFEGAKRVAPAFVDLNGDRRRDRVWDAP